MKLLMDLFFTFCKVGVMTFGGGYAMLPIVQRYVVEDKKWASDEDVMDYYAIGQCLPGIIAINTSVQIGRKVNGVPGGIAAALGVAMPSFVIIAVIAAFMKGFADVPAVQQAFSGIRIAVAALVTDAIIKMWKKGMKNLFCYIVFAFVLALSLFTKVSAVMIVILAVTAGIGLGFYAPKSGASSCESEAKK